MNYDTAIIFRDIKGDYVHSMVGLDCNGNICDASRNRLNRQYCFSPIHPIYMHTFATRDDGIKAQRAANAILKLFYVAGEGSVDARLPEETVKEVYEYAERSLTDEEITKSFIKYSKKYIDLVKNRSRNDLKGLVYVMKDYDRNGFSYYKIGMTNQGKGACGRLEQLKAEHYLSSRATCILALNFEKYFNAAKIEGYFQAAFHSKKMTAPYRPNFSNGTRDDCDECYRLNDADIETIKRTYNKCLARINNTR